MEQQTQTARLVANIPTELKRRIKIYAAQEQKTVTDIIIDAFEKLLSETEDHDQRD